MQHILRGYALVAVLGLGLAACSEEQTQTTDSTNTQPAAPAVYDFKSTGGPHGVATASEIELEYKAQDKWLLMQVTYPTTGDGPFPVIVFSHGAMCAKNTYAPIIDHWASHGYVVIEPSHLDSPTVQKIQFSQLATIADTRPGDMSFILDQLDAILAEIPELAGKVDRDNLAAAGHSMGAATAMRATGLKSRNAEGIFDMSDPRFDVSVLLSSPGTAPYTPQDAWATYTTPMFASTGTRDVTASNKNKPEGWKWRLGAFDLTPAGDKYAMITQEMDHFFGGMICHEVDDADHDPEAVAYVGGATVAFLDAYLKNIAGARDVLTPETISALTNGRSELRAK